MSAGEVRLQVAGEQVSTNDVTKGEVIDIIDRDPNHLNDHIKVAFEEIFAEPHPTIYSFDSVWRLSYKAFRNTKLWCYRITTLICAVPLSVFWGLHFGCLACCTVWCCRPCIKSYEIELSCIKGFLVAILDAIYRPCYETFGYCFYNIRIQTIKGEV